MFKAADMTHGQPMGPDWTRADRGDQVLLKEEYQTYLYRLLPAHDQQLHMIFRTSDSNGHLALLVIHELLGNPLLDSKEVRTVIPIHTLADSFHEFAAEITGYIEKETMRGRHYTAREEANFV